MKKIFAAAAAAIMLAGCGTAGTPTTVALPSTVTVNTTVTDVSRATRTVAQTHTETVTVTPTTVAVPTPTPVAYVPPEGYQLFGTADSTTSYRFLDDAEFECAATDDSCWGLSIHTQNGCSRGGSVILAVSIKDSGAGPVGEITNAWATSGPNEAVSLVVGQVGLAPTPETTLTARLQSITCSS